MGLDAGSLLQRIQSPADLKGLDKQQLVSLCGELRQFIIEAVSLNPGHFGASLGVVELTVAIHHVFNTPHDRLIWDVGHQAYAHKILTGRRERFHTNRKYGGISGFPKRSESPYDSFGTGHSSTSISAALGMALASRLKGEDRQHIAVIGDGSLTAGLAFEGLNNAGASGADILVILNDNGMAIDENVGALKDYLADVSTSRTYNRIKDEVWKALGTISRYGPDARSMIQKLEHAIKTTLLKQSNFFESLKFRYFGPIDGHDVHHLTRILSDLRDIRGPRLLHVITCKGKGFPEAEKHKTRFHAPGLFDKDTGQIRPPDEGGRNRPRYQDVFGNTLLELARSNPRIVGITPAMPTGCSLNILMGALPERAFDVGIAEQHAVTFAAGLAAEGLLPYCNVYSSFFQRAYDQFIHDVALQGLPVVFCLDRAGLVGEDGPTHHGAFDLSFLRCIPGATIAAPRNAEELRNLMFTAQNVKTGPFIIRYPRGCSPDPDRQGPFRELPAGKGEALRDGKDVAVLSVGPVAEYAAKACEELEKEEGPGAAHFDMRYIKPLDELLLHEVFSRFSGILTVEDNALAGGFGSAVLEFMAHHGYQSQVVRLGIPDAFAGQGGLKQLHAACGFDLQGIKRAIIALAEKSGTHTRGTMTLSNSTIR
jgi:1-deoxy-D-xylulose-5-phosphate synthase